MKNTKLRKLCECAVLIAAAVGLGFLKFKIWPDGGSIDIVMVPIVIICVRYGMVWGVGSGLAVGILKCLISGAFGWGLPSILLDYVLAYAAVGVGGIFKGKSWGLPYAALVGSIARFAIHYISGITIYAIVAPTEFLGTVYESASLYSIIYNGTYMLPNMILAVAVCALITPPLKKYLTQTEIKN